MAGVTGREMKALAFAKHGTNSWNVAASVTKGARFETDGGIKHMPTFIEDRSFGEQWLGPAEAGDVQPVDATLPSQARYEDHNYVLEALAMGSPATVALATSASGQVTSWRHVIDLAPSIDGLGATFAMDRKLYVDEVTSAKIYGFSETFGDGGVVMQSFKILGSQCTNISSININSTVWGASFPTLLGRIQRSQGVFRINAQGGGSLSGSDAISFAGGFEFTFERPQDRSYGMGSAHVLEPADNEFPEVSVRVTFERMNTVTANSLRSGLTVGTAYKADVTYTGGTFINSTDRYSKLYQFPYMELQEFETPTAGAAQVKPVAMFKLKKPSSAPTGMSGVTNPFRITRVMVNSVNAFA
jgi:hypothetical protein